MRTNTIYNKFVKMTKDADLINFSIALAQVKLPISYYKADDLISKYHLTIIDSHVSAKDTTNLLNTLSYALPNKAKHYIFTNLFKGLALNNTLKQLVSDNDNSSSNYFSMDLYLTDMLIKHHLSLLVTGDKNNLTYMLINSPITIHYYQDKHLVTLINDLFNAIFEKPNESKVNELAQANQTDIKLLEQLDNETGYNLNMLHDLYLYDKGISDLYTIISKAHTVVGYLYGK